MGRGHVIARHDLPGRIFLTVGLMLSGLCIVGLVIPTICPSYSARTTPRPSTQRVRAQTRTRPMCGALTNCRHATCGPTRPGGSSQHPVQRPPRVQRPMRPPLTCTLHRDGLNPCSDVPRQGCRLHGSTTGERVLQQVHADARRNHITPVLCASPTPRVQRYSDIVGSGTAAKNFRLRSAERAAATPSAVSCAIWWCCSAPRSSPLR